MLSSAKDASSIPPAQSLAKEKTRTSKSSLEITMSFKKEQSSYLSPAQIKITS
jgi:hypothetical protein